MKHDHHSQVRNHKETRRKFPIREIKSLSRTGRSKRPVHITPLEVTRLDEVRQEGDGPDLMDPHFQSELDYGGFKNVEAYDNREYRLGDRSMDNPELELDFEEFNPRNRPAPNPFRSM